MERIAPDTDMTEVERHTLEMVQMADAGGFHIVWAAEHHALEMTIAPNPFQILTWWAAHTDRIRLGTAVVVAPYWHPINVAGEAALLDLYSNGRLEFGIGAGAYQREIDRMQVDIQRYTEDAQVEVQELQAELQQEFQAQLIPIIGQVATEKNIEIVLSLADAAIIWANMGLDITNEVITQFNAASEESAPASQP